VTAAAVPALALPDVAVPRLVVLRHGRTGWNAEGRFQGQLDPPLDPVGRAQASRAAGQLAAVLPPGGTVVVSSDLVRAADTAAAGGARRDVPLRLDPRLRELFLGSWQGLTRQEVAERLPEQYADWLAGRPVRGRGSEDPDEVAGRALAAVGDLPDAEAAVVVTHGGTGLRLIEALLGLGQGARRVLGSLDNCSWSELVQQGGRWRLLRHNQSADLPGSGPVEGGSPGVSPGAAASDGGREAPAGDADVVL
jgi:probable phosphoglycerate mutase